MSGWQEIAAAHRERQHNAIPTDWLLTADALQKLSGAGTEDAGKLIKLQAAQKAGLLSEIELDITENYTASQLLSKIAARELKSVDVVTAFAKRAAIAQQLTSCLTEIFFNEAIEQAKYLDDYLEKNGKTIGPLHGLPISLKDTLVVKGQYATVGYVALVQQPIPEHNSSLVQLLLDAGAVFYCKTNVPQTMMTADSINNVFGRTLNPHNTLLTPGGSCGGEGALLAFRGSPLGIGTDVGGSLRIPANCNGIYSLKPTTVRLPFSKQSFSPSTKPRIPGIVPCTGPMGHSVEDLSLLMKIAVGSRPWKYDANSADLPWRSVDSFGKDGKLTIGVLPDAPEYPLHPPVRRTLDKAVAALEKAGHNVVRLSVDDCPDIVEATKIAYGYFGLGAPGMKKLEEMLGEPLVATVLREGHPFSDGKFAVPQDLTIPEQIAALAFVRDGYISKWKEVWLQHGLDAIISSCGQHTAVPHDTHGMVPYTMIWNVLDYPAGVIPFGKASKQDDPDFVDKSHIAFEPNYDPEVLDGAPTVIQVITPKFRDEECLEAMRVIDRDIRAV
ncbi:amidase [Thozetella sp. PMI_491]|nr:amidase [Thozetella sp. PMI_491]